MSRRPVADTPLGDAEIAAAFAGLEQASRLLVAASGGPDSTALLGSVAAWARSVGGPPVFAATVDHGLRPEARAEAEGVGHLAEALGVPHGILTWKRGAAQRTSQEAARQARYRLLAEHAGAIGATHLLTAHTLDDQAETFMLRLAAGSGLTGLAGIRREAALGVLRLVRPFLDIPKARLVATCRERGWPFVEDPSNFDGRFARARWRRTIMPLLAGEGLDAERLGRLVARLARADAALDQAAEDVFAESVSEEGGDVRLNLHRLAVEPQEIGLRVMRRVLAGGGEIGGEEATIRLERLETCFEALLAALGDRVSARRTLGGYLLALGRDGVLTVSREGIRRRGGEAKR